MKGTKPLKKLRLASIIMTHKRIAEAKAQMDLIRALWEPFFQKIDIYHEYNGDPTLYSQKYKENYFHQHKFMTHYLGVSYMLNQGIKHVFQAKKNYDYLIISSADAWVYNPDKLGSILKSCLQNRYEIATSLWRGPFFSTEFLILDPRLAGRIYPLEYDSFIINNKLAEWFNNTILPIFETYFTYHIIKKINSLRRIYLIPGRKLVFLTNRYFSYNFYSSHHDPQERKKRISVELYRLLGKQKRNIQALNQLFGQ